MPATDEAGRPERTRVAAAPGVTDVDDVEVSAAVTVSATVTDLEPGVLSVRLKLCVPPSMSLKV